MEHNETIVQMKGITKVYPNGIAANQGVDFSVRRGEIHALMGENGAGKSTLMKMLFGMEQPTEGEIIVNDEKVLLTSPTAAIAHGIGMVHQHFMLVPSLTVAENIVLGMVPKKSGVLIDYKKALEITKEYSERFNLAVNPDAKVMDIPVGMKQKVEILKALIRGAKILILDEPTAVLTTQETAELFKELIHLKEQGYTIIFISHKLKEIKQITDRLTIMRGGKTMGVFETASITEQEISRLMVGRDVVLDVEKDAPHPTDVVLRVEGLQYRIRRLGVSLVPEDRMTYGIAESASIEENVISDRFTEKRFNHGPLFDMKAIHAESDRLIEDYTVLCKSRRQKVKMLSGGNIQKVVVAREFSSDPTLIIADQPTRGIDVGATEFIRKKLVDLSRAGAAVLLVSADLNEVMELSDSLIVLYGGKIAAYFEDTSDLDDVVMGEYMLGLKRQSDEEIGRVCHEG
jgi:simple sugar transport system ATP-binding protein